MPKVTLSEAEKDILMTLAETGPATTQTISEKGLIIKDETRSRRDLRSLQRFRLVRGNTTGMWSLTPSGLRFLDSQEGPLGQS